jgi:membrane peptidoglycan carboxypeptidase
VRDWSDQPPPASDYEFEEGLELELLEDPELDPNWKPARRESRLPDWVPAPLRRVIRIAFRGAVIGFFLLLAVSLYYLVLSFRYDVKEITTMPERSIIFDMRGQELATLHGESRRLITRPEIPDFFVKALQAREDKRFFDHHGVDVLGLFRATARNASDLSFTQGASTLTMQLARNSFDLSEKNLHRKLIEIALALRIEKDFVKDEILTAYVNRIYFGSGCHGLEEAARRYFGVSAAELNDHQCALLVGIIRAPHACSPLRNLDGALKQRNEVLARMVVEGFLPQGEAEAIKESNLDLRTGEKAPKGKAALQAVRRHFEELIASREIRDGGLRLRSTIHAGIQSLLEDEMADLLKLIPGEPQIAAICINAHTGGIRGIVGGRSTESTSFNRALDARRDLGNVFTPFIYAAAAERGVPPRLDHPLRTGREIGHHDLVKLSKRLGLEGPFAEGDDLFRGGVSATPLEVVTAVATLTGGGNRPRTHFLKDLRDANLNLLFEIKPTMKPMFAPRSTKAALAMQFPGGEPRLLTGTSPAKTDLWGVSFGSRHAICVWIGHDMPRRLDDSDIMLKEIDNTIRRMALSLTP